MVLKVEGKFTTVHLGDNHWDAIDPKRHMNELKKHFLKYIKNNTDTIDMIVILGDYLDKKLSQNDESSISAFKFLNSLLITCKKHKIAIRLIKGTKTHDFDQLRLYKDLEKQFKTFKIINTVTEEDYEGVQILYLPEEYMNDQDAYYAEFKERNYDYIFGHGTWDVCAFDSQVQESERNIKGSPVFKYKEWDQCVNAKIIFGHIHTHQKYKKLMYTGSFTRWCFGEEKDKGFVVSEFDFETRQSKETFIKNTSAKKYTTVKLSDISVGDTLKDKMKHIDSLNTENENFRIYIDEEMSIDNINVMKETFSENKSLRLEVDSVKKKIEEEKPVEDHEFLKYDIVKNVQLYIKERNNVDLSEEEIQEIMSPE